MAAYASLPLSADPDDVNAALSVVGTQSPTALAQLIVDDLKATLLDNTISRLSNQGRLTLRNQIPIHRLQVQHRRPCPSSKISASLQTSLPFSHPLRTSGVYSALQPSPKSNPQRKTTPCAASQIPVCSSTPPGQPSSMRMSTGEVSVWTCSKWVSYAMSHIDLTFLDRDRHPSNQYISPLESSFFAQSRSIQIQQRLSYSPSSRRSSVLSRQSTSSLPSWTNSSIACSPASPQAEPLPRMP